MHKTKYRWLGYQKQGPYWQPVNILSGANFGQPYPNKAALMHEVDRIALGGPGGSNDPYLECVNDNPDDDWDF